MKLDFEAIGKVLARFVVDYMTACDEKEALVTGKEEAACIGKMLCAGEGSHTGRREKQVIRSRSMQCGNLYRYS
ncbi:hypothetical protein GCM10010985_25110 [Caballeronia grimmiae]|uniref:Uncharacterized protein n=1 Tax=Caballeronia grimmiae TaxID=1071679 RepID=A0ABQ1RGI7_9BURK|nr:hypothetical protein GCM10010985_25110 [Caballeronia grimmiae]